ncbi:MAG: hypothetical protein ACLQVL_34645, partial [Terriglobia bacterium]
LAPPCGASPGSRVRTLDGFPNHHVSVSTPCFEISIAAPWRGFSLREPEMSNPATPAEVVEDEEPNSG